MTTSFEAPSPAPSGRISVGDHELAYELHGVSPTAPHKLPVILVMGFSLPGRGWRFVWPTLSADRLVLSFDNRGAGDSDKPAGPYSMADFAADTLALADRLGFAQFHLVGVSMGGMIAQQLAITAKDRLASLTLIATQPGGVLARIPRFKGLKTFVTANLTKDSTKRYISISEMLFPRAFIEKVGQHALLDVLRVDFEPPIPKHARKSQLAAVFGHDARKRLGSLAGLPTLIIKPELDVLIHPKHSEELHRLIPGSRIARIADAGHGLIRQMGPEVAALIRTHIESAEATH